MSAYHKADKLKKQIKLLDLLSLIVAPVSKKHGQLINRERSRMVKQYNHVLSLNKLQSEANMSETERSLGEFFSGEG